MIFLCICCYCCGLTIIIIETMQKRVNVEQMCSFRKNNMKEIKFFFAVVELFWSLLRRCGFCGWMRFNFLIFFRMKKKVFVVFSFFYFIFRVFTTCHVKIVGIFFRLFLFWVWIFFCFFIHFMVSEICGNFCFWWDGSLSTWIFFGNFVMGWKFLFCQF